MSFYLRPISNKFTSLVNLRKQVTDINYQLSKNVKSSLFLDEFLGAQTSSIINVKIIPSNSITHLLNHNVILFNANIESPKIENKKHNWTKQQIIKLHQQKQINAQMQNILNPDLNMTLLKINVEGGKPLVTLRSKKSSLPCTKMILTKSTSDNILLSSQKDGIFHTEISPNVQSINEIQASENRKPVDSHLQNVFDILRKDLPLLFIKQMNYEIYTQDVVFINNIRGTTSVGIAQYFKQITLLKIIGHLKYAFVKLEVLKMTMHPEDNSIKVRWRIVGISGTRVFLTFWKIKVWNTKEKTDNAAAWYDGFSTFYVNNDGKIFKHIVDKTMPDQDIAEKIKTPIETKLALFVALLGLNPHLIQFCLKRYIEFLRIR
ncbi:hypothetical protein E2986_00346 [Frieseomelitta varia]|uniref:Uncharacterized protein n=1 Tax=Frieseomelitta varia TaxID=561572 RepID=A0A833W1S9_9HYME|nr:uncharacterized protein LOC122537304 [Frieseomelitta varia]KAF3430780.1 hypothetical protein E2986_00346 [Frieseomelitta varia]